MLDISLFFCYFMGVVLLENASPATKQLHGDVLEKRCTLGKSVISAEQIVGLRDRMRSLEDRALDGRLPFDPIMDGLQRLHEGETINPPQRARLLQLGEHQRQLQRLINFGIADAAGYTFSKGYRTTIPEIPSVPSGMYPLLVDNRVSLQKLCEITGVKYDLRDGPGRLNCAVPSGRPYWVFYRLVLPEDRPIDSGISMRSLTPMELLTLTLNVGLREKLYVCTTTIDPQDPDQSAVVLTGPLTERKLSQEWTQSFDRQQQVHFLATLG